MAKPQKSTRDRWLDEFSDWDAETQERMLDTCDLLHRQTKRRAKRGKDEDSTEQRADAPLLEGQKP